MAHGLEERLNRVFARWAAFVDRRPGLILAAVALVTGLCVAYAATHLGVNADPRALIDRSLPFQVRQREVDRTFHTTADAILVVVEAASPFAAGAAADRLAERLEQRDDLFVEVFVPGGGPFFARNALLYFETEQLEDLTDRLAKVQPFLAEFARDQSLVGIADLLRKALDAEREGEGTGFDLATALNRVSAVVEAVTDDRTAADPWGRALLGGALGEEARHRIVILHPRLDWGTLLNAQPHIQAIRAAASELDLASDVRVRITGDPVLNYEELIAVREQSVTVAVVSVMLFTLASWWAFRSRRVVLAMAGSLLVSLAWTNAFAAAAVGHLNQISAAVNVLIVGLGGEFGIHFCMRYSELVARGRLRREALTETAGSVGSSLFSSACTTSTGFYVFLLTDFTGVGQLGLITGTGMFLSLASTMTVLPALLAIGAPERPPANEALVAPPAWLTRLEQIPLRYAGPIRWTAALVAVGSLALLPHVRFDHNLLRLRDPSTESVATFDDLLSRTRTTPWTIDLVAPDLAAAGALAARVTELPVVAEARTLRSWVPESQDEKAEILETASFFVPAAIAESPPVAVTAQRDALARLSAEAQRASAADGALGRSARRLHTAIDEFLAGPGAGGDDDAAAAALYARLSGGIVGSLREQVSDLRPLLMPERVDVDDLPAEMRSQWIAPDGRARVEIVARQDLSDSATLERFVDEVRTVVPEAAGSAVWLVEWGRVTWKAMLKALGGSVLVGGVVLIVLWRSVWDVLLAFFPLGLAALTTCAALVLIDEPFNFANVIVIPMLLGMGIDNGVHLVHRHRTNPEEKVVLATSTARAVFYAAVTTILSFGSLAFASHRGIAAIGKLLTLGVFLTLVSYIVVLPAVLEWDDRRRRARRSAEPEPRKASGALRP